MPYFEMTRLALRWALMKPPTTQYPFAPREFIAASRGQLVFTKDNCVYCTVCAKKCPTAALTVNAASSPTVSAASSGHSGGGAFGLWELLGLAVLSFLGYRRRVLH